MGISIGAWTKHIDISHHFLRDLWEKGDLGAAHIPGEENEADICTKNIIVRLHQRHRGRIREGKLWLNQWLNISTTRREDVVTDSEQSTVQVVKIIEELDESQDEGSRVVK